MGGVAYILIITQDKIVVQEILWWKRRRAFPLLPILLYDTWSKQCSKALHNILFLIKHSWKHWNTIFKFTVYSFSLCKNKWWCRMKKTLRGAVLIKKTIVQCQLHFVRVSFLYQKKNSRLDAYLIPESSFSWFCRCSLTYPWVLKISHLQSHTNDIPYFSLIWIKASRFISCLRMSNLGISLVVAKHWNREEMKEMDFFVTHEI